MCCHILYKEKADSKTALFAFSVVIFFCSAVVVFATAYAAAPATAFIVAG
jgi:hypothetical protein